MYFMKKPIITKYKVYAFYNVLFWYFDVKNNLHSCKCMNALHWSYKERKPTNCLQITRPWFQFRRSKELIHQACSHSTHSMPYNLDPNQPYAFKWADCWYIIWTGHLSKFRFWRAVHWQREYRKMDSTWHLYFYTSSRTDSIINKNVTIN